MSHHRFIAQRSTPTRDAFTLLEVLVVMAIMAILSVAVLVAGSTMINSAKARNTRFVMGIVRDAIEEFKQGQSQSATLAKRSDYRARYGLYPPDELEVFTNEPTPGGALVGSRAPGKYQAWPQPSNPVTFAALTFQVDGLADEIRQQEHRDLAAMVLAINLFSEPASVMLEKVLESNGRVELDANGRPLQFLDRNGNETFDDDDEQITYLVDDWGQPLTYLAQRDFKPPPAMTTSSNGPDWNRVSTEMIRLNAGQPILCSYGPDGRDQLDSATIAAGDQPATLVADWADDGRINGALNADNIYPNEQLKEKLQRGSLRQPPP